MQALKGFISHEQFVNNAFGQIAVIGEMSNYSKTYSREIGQYTSDTLAPKMTLITTLNSIDGVKGPVQQALVDSVLTIAAYLFNKTLTTSGQLYADVLLQELLTNFATTANNFACGAVLTDGTYWMPEWLSWTAVNITGVETDNEIRIWMVDGSFQLQYDETEIIVVPPTDTLDDFFKTGTQVAAMLKSLTPPQTVARLQAAKAGYPETIVATNAYNYYDPMTASNIVPSNWGLLIYGPAGNNIDTINDTLVDYILANSTHSRTEWAAILPDIFKRTEVILLPSWYQYAIPDRTIQPGIYSPAMNLTATIAKLQALVPSYPAGHISTYADTFGHPYKSLSITAVGGPDNRSSLFEFTDIFSDYINVPTTSQDYNRMSQPTQAFLQLLNQLILIGEVATAFSSIPITLTRTTRDGILYLVGSIDNINYLIACKSNFPVPATPAPAGT